MTLVVTATVMARMHAHAAATYPEECCGAMLGVDGDAREVRDVLPLDNTRAEERERRYIIDPAALLAAEREATTRGLDVVGIYHSHPDHPSQASDFDRMHAMPYWSYVIVSCMGGICAQTQSWRLRDDRSAFDEEALGVL